MVEACRQLGEALVASWRAHSITPPIPPDEDAAVYAQRLVAQRCLYGVDKNPMAVNLAKVSLWLTTLARDHAFTFLDHSFRCGDSLVGLTARQIAAMHWEPGEPTLFEQSMRDRIRRVTAARREILSAREDTPYRLLEQKLSSADDALNPVRQAGDATIAAFFAASKKKARDEKRQEYAALNERAEREDLEAMNELRAISERLAEGEKGVRPFHWEVEFPEVFEIGERLDRGAGFDAIVGNPPFAGKNTLINGNADGYLDWLKQVHEESHGNADLVAHFFRRAFTVLRDEGRFGLIATNTIGQGDTRSTGLRWICTNGGEIYCARRRVKWPGQAAVVVSVVHVAKGEVDGPRPLDGREVERITAFLFHAGGHEDPAKLCANDGKSFIGSYVLGMGFTFDDTDNKGVATPIAEMHRLIEKDPRNAERIFPYLGGEELNNDPRHEHHRYVVNFEDFPYGRESLDEAWLTAGSGRRESWLRRGVVPLDYPAPVARDWPELLNLIEKKMKDQRASHSTAPWWQFERPRVELLTAVSPLRRVLAANCGATPHLALAFLPTGSVFSHTLSIFAFQDLAVFSILQARPHETWARFFGSSMKDDLRYTPSDCFETFPFPENWETHPALEAAGREYYEFRAALMIRNDEGLTKTYNRFHDPYEKDADIEKLRELHAAMDRAVLDAYGWTDVPVDCEFLLDYEIDEESWGKKKKPYRYRWPDHVRDDVLARLLELNAARAAEEARSGLAAAPKKRRTKSSRRAPQPTGMKGLFE